MHLDVTRLVIVTTLSSMYFPTTCARGGKGSVSLVVESGSVGITDRNSEPRSLEGSPGRYYVKVVADEESLSLGETATHLPAYSRVPSLSTRLRRSSLQRRREYCLASFYSLHRNRDSP